LQARRQDADGQHHTRRAGCQDADGRREVAIASSQLRGRGCARVEAAARSQPRGRRGEVAGVAVAQARGRGRAREEAGAR
jgi:hypothetical protein